MYFTLRRRNNTNSLRGIEHRFAYWRHLFGLVTRACKREIQRYTVCSGVGTLFYFLCPKLVIKRIEHLSQSLHIKVNSGKYYVYAGTLHDSPIGKRYKRISVMYLPVTSLTIFLCNVELAWVRQTCQCKSLRALLHEKLTKAFKGFSLYSIYKHCV